MEPNPTTGVLNDLSRQLFGAADPNVVVRKKRMWVTHTAFRIALDLSLIVALAMSLAAYLALVIWLWTVAL